MNEKGGFISAHWDGTSATEEQIKKETKATIRCIPLDTDNESRQCMLQETFLLEKYCLQRRIKIFKKNLNRVCCM